MRFVRKTTPARAGFVLIALMTLVLTGCPPPTEQVEDRPTFVQEVSKEELIYRVQRNVQNLASFQCPAEIMATDQKQMVPASAAESFKMRTGKPYEKRPNTRKLSGYLIFERRPPTYQIKNRVRFSADIMGERVVELLGLDDVFMVKLRKYDPEMGARPYNLYKGRFDPEVPRPKDGFSMRPQDLTDLFLCREVLASFKLHKIKATFVEIWPDYYILNVLRVDPDKETPVQLYSRIWVERHSLMVAIHQIYEPTGAMIAEARFTNYIKHMDGSDEIYIPRQVRFIWPRDKVTIDCIFRTDKLKVNYKIDEKVWRPPREHDADIIRITNTMKGYEFTPLSRNLPEEKE